MKSEETKSTLALNISMRDKLVVIIGGGSVALRKLSRILETAASVRVVALEINSEFLPLESSGLITIKCGSYISSDLKDAFLVIAATNSTLLNKQISLDAHDAGVLVLDVDNPEEGDCTSPALLRRGNLEIAVSTGGRCPTFAAAVRDKIAENIGSEYAVILDQLTLKREKLLTNGNSSTYNKEVLRSYAACLLAELTDIKGSLS